MYSQINIRIKTDLKNAFKTSCESLSTTMTNELVRFIQWHLMNGNSLYKAPNNLPEHSNIRTK